MDPLGATASIIVIFQLSHKVLGFLNEVKGASKKCEKCVLGDHGITEEVAVGVSD